MPIFTLRPPRHLGTYLGQREPLLAGERGTAQTVARMRELIDAATRDPSIVRLAKDIVRGVPPHDEIGEIQAIYNWVLSNIRFTKDPVNKEALYPPSELLKIRSGDCDDVSMLLAALLMAIGYNARLITVSANAEAPDQFSHVYVEAELNGQGLPLDAARPDSAFGEEPPVYFRKRAWSLIDDSYQDLSGTKIFMRDGTVNLRLGHLGAYPRFRSMAGMGTYTRVRQGTMVGTIGDDSTSSMIATVEGRMPAIQGQDPWESFRSRFTPWSPKAGYASAVPPPAEASEEGAAGKTALLLLGLLSIAVGLRHAS